MFCCWDLQSLPLCVGRLTKLRVLNISYSWVEALPEDFWKQQSLHFYNARHCSSLSRLPDSFGQLPNLDTLNLKSCGKLQRLHVSMGGLTKLRFLNISNSAWQPLPKYFGDLQTFVAFNGTDCSSLSRLPDSCSQLPNLETLDLTRSAELQSLPISMGGLTKLRLLNISYLRVQALPKDFRELQSL